MLWGSKSLPYSLISEVTCILNCMCITSIHIFILYTYIHMCVCMYTAFAYILHKWNHTVFGWNHIELIH